MIARAKAKVEQNMSDDDLDGKGAVGGALGTRE